MAGGAGVKDTTHALAKVRARNARVSNQDTVSWYLNEIQKHPTLVHEASVEIFKEFNTEQDEAKKLRIKQKLTVANLRLVISIAKGYRNTGVPMEDLIQEGNIGLMKAVDRYDWSKGYRFSTYATWWIRQSISQHVLKRRKTIRLPAHAAGLQRKMITAAEEYKKEMGSEPSAEELAELLNTSERIVKATMQSGRQVLSLSTPLTSDDTGSDTIGDTITDTSLRANPFESVAENQLIEIARRVLHDLSPKEAQILRLRFGISENPTNSQDFSITQEELELVALKGQGLTNSGEE
jgi:RNA polymerase primary sigma factor